MKVIILLDGSEGQVRRIADRVQDMITDGGSEFEDVNYDYGELEK